MAYNNRQDNRPDLPDGEYIIKLLDIERGHTRTEAKPFVKFLFEILEGPHKGKCDEKTSMLSTEKAIAQFSGELRKLGFNIANGREFLGIVDELKTACLRIDVKNLKDGNRLIFFAGIVKPKTDEPGAWDF